MIQLFHVEKKYGNEAPALLDVTPGDPQGRVRLPHRPLRRRQVHAAPADLLRRAPHGGPGPGLRAERGPDPRVLRPLRPAQHRRGLPGLQAAREPDPRRERGLSPSGQGSAPGRGGPARDAGAARGGARAPRQPVPAQPLRRGAAARRGGEGAGGRPRPAPRRRAHRQPRRRADGGGAATPRGGQRPRDHRGGGHPRPGPPGAPQEAGHRPGGGRVATDGAQVRPAAG